MSKIEKAIIYIGLGLAFFKTGEAMAAYAPRAVFGWKSDWISFIWAYLGAFMVEGVLYVAYSKLVTPGKDRNARYAAWLVAGLSITFSLAMNKIDQSITDGTLATIAGNSPLALLHNVVFAIPLIGAVLFMVMDIIDRQTPDYTQPNRSQGKSNGSRPMQVQSQHQPVARWSGVNVSERPLGRAALGAGPDDSDPIDIALLSQGQPSENGRKFQLTHEPMPTLVERHGH